MSYIYPLSHKDIENCQFHIWYPLFEKFVFKSKIIQFPTNFLEYLQEESVFMPQSIKKEEDKSEFSAHKFEDFEKQICESITNEFEGKVFIRLNWNSPKDVSWLIPDFKYENISQIYQSLKCSDFTMINFDNSAYEKCDPLLIQETIKSSKNYLVLQRWHKLREEMEFRCFVIKNKLIAICQKTAEIHTFLGKEQQNLIMNKISTFFDNNIKEKFPNETFVFDIYVDIAPKYRLWIRNFLPWNNEKITDPLIFTWEELSEIHGQNLPEIVFKNIEISKEESKTQEISSHPMSKHRFPIVFSLFLL